MTVLVCLKPQLRQLMATALSKGRKYTHRMDELTRWAKRTECTRLPVVHLNSWERGSNGPSEGGEGVLASLPGLWGKVICVRASQWLPPKLPSLRDVLVSENCRKLTGLTPALNLGKLPYLLPGDANSLTALRPSAGLCPLRWTT